MAALSDYLENALVNHLFRNTDFTRPANIYIALFTTATADDGTGTEVTGGSYVRVAVATGVSSGWDASSGGATANTGVITFPTATANWGTITHVAAFDAISAGNMLFHGALSASKVVNSGDTFSVAAGAFDFAFQ